MHIVSAVDQSGFAARHGIRVGDVIVQINGEKLIDEIDYQALTAQRHVNLLIRKIDGELKEVDILKSAHAGLGIEFEE